MIGDVAALRLCVVTDRALAKGRPVVDLVAAALAGGATMAQLRAKDGPTRTMIEEGRALKALLAAAGAPLIVNDRVDVALAIDADGVHVGQTDMPVATVRALIGRDKIIGLSIANAAELAREDARAADYLGIGPIYWQSTKPDASAPLGVGGVARLRAMTDLPVVAIGGLSPENSAPVVAAGANGLAVVSAIVGASDPKAAAARFKTLFA